MSDEQFLPNDALSYYNQGCEEQRLLNGSGKLEFARTQEILGRYLQHPPAIVLDVGGGAGIHALPLARLGYQVHLVDAVPLHVEQARLSSQAQPNHPLASAEVGDARQLQFADNSADAVLLFGPLYHLTEQADRLRALQEAYRVLKPSGRVIAAVISRYASLFDGLIRGFNSDPEFIKIVERDLTDGQHRNPNNHPRYFATTYFHRATDIQAELERAGFTVEATLAVEGPGWLMSNFEEVWSHDDQREQLLQFVRRVEAEPTLIGVSSHVICIGRKP